MVMDLFGFRVEVVFLLAGGRPLTYAWHYTRDRALKHLRKIAEYHGIEGEVVEDGGPLKWLEDEVKAVVLKGKRFILPDFPYRHREVYEALLRIPRGQVRTYGEVAKEIVVPFPTLLTALMRKPFQILIPCHRLITSKGTLMGFYPLGREVKGRLLCVERAIRCSPPSGRRS